MTTRLTSLEKYAAARGGWDKVKGDIYGYYLPCGWLRCSYCACGQLHVRNATPTCSSCGYVYSNLADLLRAMMPLYN